MSTLKEMIGKCRKFLSEKASCYNPNPWTNLKANEEINTDLIKPSSPCYLEPLEERYVI